MDALMLKLRSEKSILRCLYYCLEYTRMYPQDIGSVGVAWISINQIFMHTKTFGQFASKIPNTINKYLHNYEFSCTKLSDEQKSNYLNSLMIPHAFDGPCTLRCNKEFNILNARKMITNPSELRSRNNNQMQQVQRDGESLNSVTDDQMIDLPFNESQHLFGDDDPYFNQVINFFDDSNEPQFIDDYNQPSYNDFIY